MEINGLNKNIVKAVLNVSKMDLPSYMKDKTFGDMLTAELLKNKKKDTEVQKEENTDSKTDKRVIDTTASRIGMLLASIGYVPDEEKKRKEKEKKDREKMEKENKDAEDKDNRQ